MASSSKQPVSTSPGLERLARLLEMLDTGGAERFAGFAFDAAPPYFYGFPHERPRYRRIVRFVPGHHTAPEV